MRAVLTLLMLFSWPGFSADLGVSRQALSADLVSSDYDSRWNVEGEVQAHSVAGPASPWLGLAGSYRFSDSMSLGLRGFLPVSQTVDKSTYSLQAYLRTRLVHRTFTDLFIEPECAENFYNFVPFNSYGLAIGTLSRVGSGLSVGVLGGMEFARVVIDSVGMENRKDLIVYPKVALLASFNL